MLINFDYTYSFIFDPICNHKNELCGSNSIVVKFFGHVRYGVEGRLQRRCRYFLTPKIGSGFRPHVSSGYDRAFPVAAARNRDESPCYDATSHLAVSGDFIFSAVPLQTQWQI